jgi:hypothetical protein
VRAVVERIFRGPSRRVGLRCKRVPTSMGRSLRAGSPAWRCVSVSLPETLRG